MSQVIEEQTDLVARVVEEHRYDQNELIAILQDIQQKQNWLSEAAMKRVAEKLAIPVSRVFGIASFYKAFSLKPRGKYVVQYCSGTACHVRGGPRVKTALQNFLDVKVGETTADKRFTLEEVRCLGCCSLAPVVMVGDDFHGQLNQSKVIKKLNDYE